MTYRDLVEEAVAGILQRPGRSALTALGTVLGVGAFVAVLGLTTTAGGQISRRFTAEVATEVTVADTGGRAPETVPNAFPTEADSRVRAINGVREAGVWWPVETSPRLDVPGTPVHGTGGAGDVPVIAASPGLLRALHPTVAAGRLFDEFHDAHREQVVVLGAEVARRLGVQTLSVRPAVFIGGEPFTVVGIVDDVRRRPDLLFAALVPRQTAERRWGPPGATGRAQMLIETRVGAAHVVGAQVAVALRPDAPELFAVTTPPDPHALRDAVTTDLTALFLLLAGIALVIGAVGIANTTMVAVLERVGEIGLRRALGARPRQVAAQFLTESAAVGTAGGCAGACLGVLVVVGVAVAHRWTPVLDPLTVVVAPFVGTVVGVLAGAYPAVRAARIEPVSALRR